LNQNRPEPPKDKPVVDLEWLKKDMLENPLPAKVGEQAKINAALGTSNVQATAVFRDESDQTVTLDIKRIQPKDTVVFKNCKDSNYTIDAYHTKLVIDNCSNCTFIINGKVVSAVAELYKCEKIVLKLNVAVKTLQIDKCTDVEATFKANEMFHSIVWAGTRQLKLSVPHEDSPLTLTTGLDVFKEKHPDREFNEDIDQFITRIVEEKLLTEKLIRLANGFPTTQREKDAFEYRQSKNIDAFAKNAGIKFYRTEIKGEKAPPRNKPCPCGSGKKYKVCCGAPKKKEEL